MERAPRTRAGGPDTAVRAHARVSASGASAGLYFQRPPTLPLAVAPAFLLLQMGSKLVLSFRPSGARPWPSPLSSLSQAPSWRLCSPRLLAGRWARPGPQSPPHTFLAPSIQAEATHLFLAQRGLGGLVLRQLVWLEGPVQPAGTPRPRVGTPWPSLLPSCERGPGRADPRLLRKLPLQMAVYFPATLGHSLWCSRTCPSSQGARPGGWAQDLVGLCLRLWPPGRAGPWSQEASTLGWQSSGDCPCCLRELGAGSGEGVARPRCVSPDAGLSDNRLGKAMESPRLALGEGLAIMATGPRPAGTSLRAHACTHAHAHAHTCHAASAPAREHGVPPSLA